MVQRFQFEKMLEHRNSLAYIASTSFLSLGSLT